MRRALAISLLVLLAGCGRLGEQARRVLAPPAQTQAVVVPPGAVGGTVGIAEDAGGTSGVAGGLIVDTLKKTMTARP